MRDARHREIEEAEIGALERRLRHGMEMLVGKKRALLMHMQLDRTHPHLMQPPGAVCFSVPFPYSPSPFPSRTSPFRPPPSPFPRPSSPAYAGRSCRRFVGLPMHAPMEEERDEGGEEENVGEGREVLREKERGEGGEARKAGGREGGVERDVGGESSDGWDVAVGPTDARTQGGGEGRSWRSRRLNEGLFFPPILPSPTPTIQPRPLHSPESMRLKGNPPLLLELHATEAAEGVPPHPPISPPHPPISPPHPPISPSSPMPT
ncbi:unnamed protein product, partial [Closterium sp. Naga37s-1]